MQERQAYLGVRDGGWVCVLLAPARGRPGDCYKQLKEGGKIPPSFGMAVRSASLQTHPKTATVCIFSSCHETQDTLSTVALGAMLDIVLSAMQHTLRYVTGRIKKQSTVVLECAFYEIFAGSQLSIPEDTTRNAPSFNCPCLPATTDSPRWTSNWSSAAQLGITEGHKQIFPVSSKVRRSGNTCCHLFILMRMT